MAAAPSGSGASAASTADPHAHPTDATGEPAGYADMLKWRASREWSSEDTAFLTDLTLRRYIVARNGDVAAAQKCLLDTLAWRREHVNPPLHCTVCADDPHMHCFFPLGCGRIVTPYMDSDAVVVYANAARAKTNVTDVTLRHMVHTLEHAWEVTGAPRLTWLVDFHGFGFWHAMEGRTSISTVNAFATHMPERLAAVVLLNPPTVFDLLLKLLWPIIDARTRSRVHVIHATTPDAVYDAAKSYGISRAMAEWVCEGMKLPATPGHLPPLTGPHFDDAFWAMQLPHMRTHHGKDKEAEGGGSGSGGSTPKA